MTFERTSKADGDIVACSVCRELNRNAALVSHITASAYSLARFCIAVACISDWCQSRSRISPFTAGLLTGLPGELLGFMSFDCGNACLRMP